MNNRKTLQELTLKDNFMFGAVMQEQNWKTAGKNMKMGL